jgi:hypothetical protein
MSEPAGVPPSSSPDPLQFERAELQEPAAAEAQGVQCAFCQTPIHSVYFDLNGQTACDACRLQAEAELRTRPGVRGFLRSLAAGFGAAVLGSAIYYGVRELTGYEVGLISILVGFMVGGAVRWGARGKGGWVYQTLAIGLTYLAIVSTYIPVIVQSFQNGTEGADQAAMAEVTAPAVDPATGPATPGVQPAKAAAVPEDAAEDEGGLGMMLLATALITALAMVAPFLAGFDNIIGLLIIGFGLWEAWRLNKRSRLEVLGPYAISPGKAAVPEPAAPAV